MNGCPKTFMSKYVTRRLTLKKFCNHGH
jgi:ribosomal protein L33